MRNDPLLIWGAALFLIGLAAVLVAAQFKDGDDE